MINCGAAPPVKVVNSKYFTNDIRRWFVQFTALSALASAPLLALQTEDSGGPLRADQACFDVQHYELILVVVPESKKIGASLTMTARMGEASKQISLDLDSCFTVRRVTVGGVEVEASHKEGRIEIPLPEGQGRASHEKRRMPPGSAVSLGPRLPPERIGSVPPVKWKARIFGGLVRTTPLTSRRASI
jgi:hypothetical protein